MLSEEPEISLINVKARMGPVTLYTEKVSIDLQSHVSVLKDKLREKVDCLGTDNFIMTYSGNVMEDSVPIYMYDIFSGATVHLYKKLKIEKYKPVNGISTRDSELVKLGVALRSLSLNLSYKCAFMKMNKTRVINDLVYNTPQFSEDPVGITLLQHSELLLKLNDLDLVKRIAEYHPGLASVALQVSSITYNKDVQNHLIRTGTMFNGSTSGAGESTSTGNTRNALILPPSIVRSEPTTAVDYSHQLGIMRDMGLYNEPLNQEGLRLGGGDLETAIELVLSGFQSLHPDNS